MLQYSDLPRGQNRKTHALRVHIQSAVALFQEWISKFFREDLQENYQNMEGSFLM